MPNDESKKINQAGTEDTGLGSSAEEIIATLSKSQPNGRSFVVQLVAILTSLGLLGGGGFIGLDAIKSELKHNNDSVTAVVKSVDEIKPLVQDVKHLQKQVDELRGDFKGMGELKTEILDRIAQIEDKLDEKVDEVRKSLVERVQSIQHELAKQTDVVEKELTKDISSMKDEIYREIRKVKDDIMEEIRNIRDRLSGLEATIKALSAKE